jgi:hypothetical protein
VSDEQLLGQLKALGDALNITQQVEAALSLHTGDRDWLERQVARLQGRYAQTQVSA